jgi:hypothetical protein
MNLEERIAANAEKGYIYVGTIGSEDLWKKSDEFSTVYYLDEGYDEGCFPIWSTVRNHRILPLIYEDIEKH